MIVDYYHQNSLICKYQNALLNALKLMTYHIHFTQKTDKY